MTIREILSDGGLLEILDNLTRDQEVTQECLLTMLEIDHELTNRKGKTLDNWTEEKVIEVFSKQIDAVKSRMKRQSDRRIAPKRQPTSSKPVSDHRTEAEQDHADLENLQIIEQLPANLRPVARRLYKGYTRQEIANDLNVDTSTVYRHKIAIQENLLDCVGA
jgi:DNA-directed RNA polymerase specialized sigma24 family protein